MALTTRSHRIAQLLITLERSRPIIWRRVEVPVTASLFALHDVIQAVMLFEDRHLWRFDVGPRSRESHYGPRHLVEGILEPIVDARYVRIESFIDRGIEHFNYTYDFGDDWRLSVLIEIIKSSDPFIQYPRLVEGSRRAPPEDVGGEPGFALFLKAMSSRSHPEHRRLKSWYGGDYDPLDMSTTEIHARLEKLAPRHLTGKNGKANSRRPPPDRH